MKMNETWKHEDSNSLQKKVIFENKAFRVRNKSTFEKEESRKSFLTRNKNIKIDEKGRLNGFMPNQRQKAASIQNNKRTVKRSHWTSKRGIRNFLMMENQDHVLVDENNKNYRLYGIFDGHGKFGKKMAEIAATKIGNKYNVSEKRANSQSLAVEHENLIKNAISEVNKYFFTVLPKECENSGTTMLLIMVRNQLLYCFNIGSSRAVLGKKSFRDSKLYSLPLSTDQNLNRFDERARILKTEAVIEETKDENGCRIGPQRIWKKGEKSPGIYITRSLGMKFSLDVGIISEPEVICIKIRQTFEFVLMGSDGFWEVFQTQQAIKFLEEYWKSSTLELGVENLRIEAIARWDKKPDLMDDITILLIKIDK